MRTHWWDEREVQGVNLSLLIPDTEKRGKGLYLLIRLCLINVILSTLGKLSWFAGIPGSES